FARADLKFFVRQTSSKSAEINHEGLEGYKEFAVVTPVKFCSLVFVGCFCFYRRVPAVDDGSSRRAISESTQTGVVAFTTTHWSVVLAAGSESAAARDALEKLCRTYWWRLYGFVRRQDHKCEVALELTQA